MSLSDGIKRLLRRLVELEERVYDLEERMDVAEQVDAYDVGVDQIGFEVDLSDDFDEDESEYRRKN
jgi:hypothetical protein